MGLLKKITSNPLRAAAAVGTFGSSELALAGAKKLGLTLDGEQGEYVTPEQHQQRLYRAFANDYDNQMNLADKGVQESAMTKNLYGQGGLNERLNSEEQKLASQGFQLTQDDREAYGQTAGDVSRLFGQQEQAATQNLARRGLASASSGASGAMFSGLAGNKNEMLAKAQTDIANKRMQNTLQRLQQTRNQMQTLGVQGADLARTRYQDKGQGLMNAVNVENLGNEQNRNALQDKNDAFKPGLLETIGNGLQTGIGNLASAAPGMAVGGLGGGAASSGGAGQAPGGLSRTGMKQDRAGGTTGYSRAYMNEPDYFTGK